ncbi:hypothetical protein O181_045454 [Austropuccinia psidii MF-1]|uniref:Uncharacterized protein n=1 Tax=Austropuccinia psidii MF-1 TaxID=1389203 RepID=A0A9Q3DM86_9BASI|nr:hypothetical protein [Austropuccinia psidii MF-1]
MELAKGLNPNNKFKLLKERETKIRQNQATVQAIEEQWIQKEHILTPLVSQVVYQTNSQVASHKSVAKSHHYSQFWEVFRRIKGPKARERLIPARGRND